MKSLIAICFFNLIFGLSSGYAIGKYKIKNSVYDVYSVLKIDTQKPCPRKINNRVISVSPGYPLSGFSACSESTSWNSDYLHVDSVYLCQSPSMIDEKIIESVNWDQLGMIGIGTVEVYNYDEKDNEICYSKFITNWIKR